MDLVGNMRGHNNKENTRNRPHVNIKAPIGLEVLPGDVAQGVLVMSIGWKSIKEGFEVEKIAEEE